MNLKRYKEKRDFKNTSEPETKGKIKGDKLAFVVHKHNASRMHYDLRLELNGVLKSWAVPKGPTLNPSLKRLAVMVEDHPLTYLKYEGAIARGNYGAGDVIIWDYGFYIPKSGKNKKENEKILNKQLKEGKLEFYLEGKKLNGIFYLIKSKDKNWILIKGKDGFANGKKKLDEGSVISDRTIYFDQKGKDKQVMIAKPMLAFSSPSSFNDPNWIFEIKWDGYRAIAYIKKSGASLLSRNNKIFDELFPSIIGEIKKINHDATIDGEIVYLEKNGKTNFQALQNCAPYDPHIIYYVFDVLFIDGHDTKDLPLGIRKRILKTILPELANVRYSDHIEGAGNKLFAMAKKKNLEGIIAKKIDSKYVIGRSRNWLKFKIFNSQEAVIVGYTEPSGSRKYFGSLVLAVYDKGNYIYVGNVGSGFTDETLKKIYTDLKKIKTKVKSIKGKIFQESRITWVFPKIVCEVNFAQWTKEGQMRHPIFKGIRSDKMPTDAIRE